MSSPAPDRPKPGRLTLWLLVGPLVVLVIASYVGDALSPTLVAEHPLWLIALNARNRNLVLVTNSLDAVSYYMVGGIRLLLADPLFYLLGYFYGDAAVQWAEQRSRTFGGMLRSVEQFFQKASYPLVLLAPNNPICLFAGASGMSPPVFLLLNITGTIGRLYLIRWVGDIFADPIATVTDFIREYRLPLTALTVVVTGALVWNESRGEGETEFTALVHLEDELEEIEDEIEEREHPHAPDSTAPTDGAESAEPAEQLAEKEQEP